MGSVPNAVKRCYRCQEDKPFNPVYYVTRKGVLQNICRACAQLSSKQSRQKQVALNKTLASRPTGEKVCRLCQQMLSVTDFHKKASSKDGLDSACATCSNAKRREYERNPRYAKTKAEWHARNPNAGKVIKKRWRDRHPDKVRALSKAYRLNNPSATRAAKARRRSWASATNYTAREWDEKLQAYGGRCHWCYQKIEGRPHADHLIALAKGGSNDIGNIVPACAKCNLTKNAKLPWEFMEGRLL